MTNCNARIDPVFSQLYCEVPLTTLRTGPFSLPLGKIVVAKVRALNAIGYSNFSQVNNVGAQI